jgi:hypothetical protein
MPETIKPRRAETKEDNQNAIGKKLDYEPETPVVTLNPGPIGSASLPHLSVAP